MKQNKTYELVNAFKKKYPFSFTWFRLKAHSKLVDKFLNPDEKVLFAFAGQNDNKYGSVFNTAVLAITDERLIIAQDRLIVGYKVTSVTPDLYNDLKVDSGLIWGKIKIDTVKEKIYFSNLSKKSLPEIKKHISSFMMDAKKKYPERKF